MQKRSIRGMTKHSQSVLRDERGAVAIISVFAIIVILVLIAGFIEFGRIMLVREQLQTAADSAALAGAGSGTHRYVKINVVTDRGDRTVCSKDGCWCASCGTTTVSNIPGDEKTLIDEGGWRNYCVEPCDCGGGDCWFELVSRDLMYDTKSAGWGISQQDLNNVEKELTNATRVAVAESDYYRKNSLYRLLGGKNLTQIANLLNNRSNFISEWLALKGCSYWGWYWDENQECREWHQQGVAAYSNASQKKEFANRNVATMKNMRQVNSRTIPRVDEQYTGAAGRFFEANLPKHAEKAAIGKIKVYGYEQRNSPYYPSVVVYATAKIKTLFPQVFKDDFNTTVCAQGSTSFRDAEHQKSWGNKFYGPLKGGKWNRMPDDACWVDW